MPRTKIEKEATSAISNEQVQEVVKKLSTFYSNKSTDAYKMKGDITKSAVHDKMRDQIDDLVKGKIKGYPENDAKVLANVFKFLHKPIFPKMVTEYLRKPDPKNTAYTGYFTLCYYLLIGELSRIFGFTEATENGIVFNTGAAPSKNNDAMNLLRRVAIGRDEYLEKAVKEASKKKDVVQEAAITAATAATAGAVVNTAVGAIEATFNFLGNIFKSAVSLNPISLMSAVFSRSYDKKVAKYNDMCDMYEAAKQAYEEYKKLPASKRKERTEHKYQKLIDKYNMKMKTLQKQIDHYDYRARENDEDDDESTNVKTDKKKLPKSSSTVDTTSNTDTEKKEDSSNKNDADFDF